MHHTKRKGDIGVTKAIARLTELNWNIGVLVTEHAPYDFFAEKDGKIDTIQARYTTPTNGVLQVKLSSSWADKNGNHKRKRKKQDFTVLSVYNPEDDRVYFIRASGFNNGRAINLRLVPAANGQKRGVRMAEDYLEL